MSTTVADLTANVRQVVPFLWVHDLDASRRFYVDGLGFRVTRHWIDEGKMRWCWMELGGASLMLQEFWREGHHRNLPQTPVGVGVSVAFICADALAVYRAIVARGIDATRPAVGNGMWVTDVIDPDGYRLFFESPTDAAEGTVLSAE